MARSGADAYPWDCQKAKAKDLPIKTFQSRNFVRLMHQPAPAQISSVTREQFKGLLDPVGVDRVFGWRQIADVQCDHLLKWSERGAHGESESLTVVNVRRKVLPSRT